MKINPLFGTTSISPLRIELPLMPVNTTSHVSAIIRGQKKFILPYPYHQRTAFTGCNNLIGIILVKHPLRPKRAVSEYISYLPFSSSRLNARASSVGRTSSRCMVMAARAAGVDVYDTPWTDVEDYDGLVADAQFAKSLGFTGKASISPRHIPFINEVFSPTMEEIQYAKDVFETIERAKAEGKGVVSLRGKMIDAPIVARANQVLEAAEAMGLYERPAETAAVSGSAATAGGADTEGEPVNEPASAATSASTESAASAATAAVKGGSEK